MACGGVVSCWSGARSRAEGYTYLFFHRQEGKCSRLEVRSQPACPPGCVVSHHTPVHCCSPTPLDDCRTASFFFRLLPWPCHYGPCVCVCVCECVSRLKSTLCYRCSNQPALRGQWPRAPAFRRAGSVRSDLTCTFSQIKTKTFTCERLGIKCETRKISPFREITKCIIFKMLNFETPAAIKHFAAELLLITGRFELRSSLTAHIL